MNRRSIRTFVATLSYYQSAKEGLTELVCRGCRDPLDLHQPNPEQPNQFLGTCSGCGRWYRVDCSTGRAGLTVLELPEVASIPGPPPTS